MGGLPRRTTALSQLRTEHPAHVVVDAGGTLSARHLDDLDAARRKAELVARVLGRDGIDAMALSERDWLLGKGFVQEQIRTHDLPVLAANLTCEGERPYPRSTVIERGGQRVGVVGLTQGVVPGCTVTEPVPALIASLGALPPVDLSVVLMPTGRSTLKQLDDIDVDVAIVTTSAARLDLGQTLAVSANARGKSLGVIVLEGGADSSGVFSQEQLARLRAEVARRERTVADFEARATREPGDPAPARRLEHEQDKLAAARSAVQAYGDGAGRWRARSADVGLGDEVDDHAPTQALVKEVLAGLEARTGVTIVNDAPRLVQGHGAYAGSDACLTCHPAQHAQWAGTPHASAWASLRDDQHGMDPACVECHVTGWKQSGGPSSVERLEPFRGVQCEACHGPARAHLRDPARIKPVEDPPVQTCTACHDGDRDMGRFEPEAYRARVVHSPQQTAAPLGE